MILTVKRLGSLAILIVLAVSVSVATEPVPRKSVELTIVEPSGKQTLLSSFQGKVVVIEFLLIDCPHCMRVAQMISRLHKELGPRGFRPVGIAFDPGINEKKVADFARRVGTTYPIGYTSSVVVDGYLGRKTAERFMVPQIVVIDRKGMIRAQSRPVRELNLENENYLRNLLDGLLKEGTPAASTRKVLSPAKS
jgi:thiol-disulfide isomerase/thioredoxin